MITKRNSKYAQTYAACASQVVMHLFTALAALKNYLILRVDATNAFAQLPLPSESTYVYIKNQYTEWHKRKCGTEFHQRKVLPVQHALQGHPKVGWLWTKLIENHLV